MDDDLIFEFPCPTCQRREAARRRSRSRRPTRALIPNPYDSHEAATRFAHRDLADLTAAELWAEQMTLEAALADRLTRRQRSRVISAWPRMLDEHQWLLERLRTLRKEQQRRGLHVR
jgi:hypothetical protein